MKRKRWTTVGLNRSQICFLDRISKDSRFSEGRKLCRTAIIRALLRACRTLDVDLSMVKSEEELRQRILSSFKKPT